MKKFRLSAKNLFLTYPKTSLEKREVLEQLEKKLSIKKYVISRENHSEEGNPYSYMVRTRKKGQYY